jgi:hypothetical protein
MPGAGVARPSGVIWVRPHAYAVWVGHGRGRGERATSANGERHVQPRQPHPLGAPTPRYAFVSITAPG